MKRFALFASALIALTPQLTFSQTISPGSPAPGITSLTCPSGTITTSGVCSPLPTAGTSGDVVTAAGSNGAQDSGTLLSSLAPLASPALTGAPTAPTQSGGDNSTKIATTAFVASAVSGTGFVAPTALTGHWYMPPLAVVAAGTIGVAARMSCATQINFAPAYTVKALGFRITTLGTSYTQVAIYANSAGRPNGAPLGYTSGTDGVNTATALINGPLTDAGASGSTFVLPSGVYWACAVSNDGAAGLQIVSNAQALSSAFVGSTTQANINNGGALAEFVVYQGITCNASAATGCTFPTVTSSGWNENVAQAVSVMNQAN